MSRICLIRRKAWETIIYPCVSLQQLHLAEDVASLTREVFGTVSKDGRTGHLRAEFTCLALHKLRDTRSQNNRTLRSFEAEFPFGKNVQQLCHSKHQGPIYTIES
jgi:hypothetical protein